VGCGSIFYVNGGSDWVTAGGDGSSPATAFRTLQAGINACTSNNNDVVVVLNYGGNARAIETFPINVNKDLVHIIGVSTPASKWAVVSVLTPAGADTAKPALNVTGGRVEICGLELGGGDTAGCVHVGTLGGVWACYIHDCFFGITGDSVGQDGIRVPVTFDAPYLNVDACRFGAYITRDGVRLDGNATRCMIGMPNTRGNVFKAMVGIAINLAGTVVMPGIFNNVIALPANTAGAGITLSANVSGGIIDGNRANFGKTAMANNPFVDGAATNSWILNYKATAATLP